MLNPPIEIMDWGIYLILAAVTAVANMWIGWEHGDRYTGSISIGFVGWLFLGYAGILIGLAMLGWRFVGWFRALDLGRSDHSVQRDFLVMAATTAVPIFIFSYGLWHLGYGFAGLWSLSLAVFMPTCYAIAMWVPPWDPKYDHIKYAEALAGAVFGLIGVAMILN